MGRMELEAIDLNIEPSSAYCGRLQSRLGFEVRTCCQGRFSMTDQCTADRQDQPSGESSVSHADQSVL